MAYNNNNRSKRQVVKRVNAVKDGDFDCSGLGIAYFEHKGELIRITISRAKNPKSDRHRAWIKAEIRDKNGGRNNRDNSL